MKGKGKILIMVAALIALAGLAIASGPGFSMGGNVNCPAGMNQLNLTPEQKTKLGELREKHWKDSVSLRNEMQTKRLELRTLWTAPTPDKNKIMAKQRELNELRDKMQVKATDFQLDIRKVLTPEQAAQLGTLGLEMGFHHGMGRMRMWRQGPCSGPGQGPGLPVSAQGGTGCEFNLLTSAPYSLGGPEIRTSFHFLARK
jgi:zinc resistance-associated protein